MKSENHRSAFLKIARFLPAILWMSLIFYLSSRQKVAISENYVISFIFFKTLHIIEYGTLFLLWDFALYKNKNGRLIAVVISILYGISDELHQRFVPTREGRARDVFIDALGVFIFWYFLADKVFNLLRRYKILERFLLF